MTILFCRVCKEKERLVQPAEKSAQRGDNLEEEQSSCAPITAITAATAPPTTTAATTTTPAAARHWRCRQRRANHVASRSAFAHAHLGHVLSVQPPRHASPSASSADSQSVLVARLARTPAAAAAAASTTATFIIIISRSSSNSSNNHPQIITPLGSGSSSSHAASNIGKSKSPFMPPHQLTPPSSSASVNIPNRTQAFSSTIHNLIFVLVSQLYT